MSCLADLLESGNEATIRFFASSLANEVLPSGTTEEHLKYVASIHAHWALVSTSNTAGYERLEPTLADVFEKYVLVEYEENTLPRRVRLQRLEIGASQIILHAGFLRDQSSHRGRHNHEYFEQIGASFYNTLSLETSGPKSELYMFMSKRFNRWTSVGCRMARTIKWESDTYRYGLKNIAQG